MYLRCDINKTCVCLPLGLFYITTLVSTIILMVVYIYLTLSMTSQHTSFPMLTITPLDRASLVPSIIVQKSFKSLSIMLGFHRQPSNHLTSLIHEIEPCI